MSESQPEPRPQYETDETWQRSAFEDDGFYEWVDSVRERHDLSASHVDDDPLGEESGETSAWRAVGAFESEEISFLEWVKANTDLLDDSSDHETNALSGDGLCDDDSAGESLRSSLSVCEGSPFQMTYDNTVYWRMVNREDVTLIMSPESTPEDLELLELTAQRGVKLHEGRDGMTYLPSDTEKRVVKQYDKRFGGIEGDPLATLRASESLRVGLGRTSQLGPWTIGGVAILAAAIYSGDDEKSARFVMERVDYIERYEHKVPKPFDRRTPPSERKRLRLYNKAMRATGVPVIPPDLPEEVCGTVEYDDHNANLLVEHAPGSRFSGTGKATKIDIVATRYFNF